MLRNAGILVRRQWAGFLALFLVLTGGAAFAAIDPIGADGDIDACYAKSGALSIQKGAKCPKGKKPVAWSQAGPRGPAGADGANGADGPAGSPDTPQQVLDKLVQVDGAGSGISADTLDGNDAAFFQRRGSSTSCAGGNVATALGANGDLACSPDQGVPARRAESASTTPSVAGLTALFLNYGTPTTITSLPGGVGGQVVTLHQIDVAGTTTINDSAPFNLAGTWTSGFNDTLTLVTDGLGQWTEVARSDN